VAPWTWGWAAPGTYVPAVVLWLCVSEVDIALGVSASGVNIQVISELEPLPLCFLTGTLGLKGGPGAPPAAAEHALAPLPHPGEQHRCCVFQLFSVHSFPSSLGARNSPK